MLKLRKPAWWAVLLTLAGVVLFVELGLWQLRRADTKAQMLATFKQANQQPAVPFAAAVDGLQAGVYPHVRVRGRLQGTRAYVLDNRTHHGRVGIEVFVPMQVCLRPDPCHSYRSRTLLVALGFLPRDHGWKSLPKLPPVSDRLQVLTGLYAPPPGQGLKLGGNALARQRTWPKVTTWLDLRQVADDLHQPLDQRVLLLDPDPASAYVRIWTPSTMPPARHRAYAVQWFGFALAAIVIFLLLNRQRPRDDDDPGATPGGRPPPPRDQRP